MQAKHIADTVSKPAAGPLTTTIINQFNHILNMKKLLLFLTLALALVLPTRAAETLWDVTFDYTGSSEPAKTAVAKTPSGETFNITLTFEAGGNKQNSPTYKSKSLYWYGANKITVSSDGNIISQIEFVSTSDVEKRQVSKNVTFSSGGWTTTGKTSKWDGNTKQVTFQNTTNQSTAAIYIAKIIVHYVVDSGTTLQPAEVNWYDSGEKITSYETTVGADPNPNVYAYSTQAQIESYSSSNTSVATVDGSGTITPLAVGTCDITAVTAANKSYASGKAVLKLTVKEAANPAPVITFSHADGEYAYNTPMYFTVKNADSDNIVYTVKTDEGKNITVTSDGNNKYSFNLTYDAAIEVYALNDNDDATVTGTFLVKRPEAPTFSPDAGAVTEGTEVTFKSATADVSKIVYSVLDNESADWLVEDAEVSGNTGSYTVNKAVTITAKAYLPNGYASDAGEAEYTIKALPAPSAPVFSIADKSAVEDGSEVTVTAENAEKIYVAEYFIDGELGEYREYTAPLTVDKMHRRFIAYAENKTGTSDKTEVFYTVKKTTAGSGVTYRLVQDMSDIEDGGRYVVFAHATGTANKKPYEVWHVMNNTFDSSKGVFGGIDAKSYLSDDELTLNGIPEGTQIIELSAATGENNYYINAKNGETDRYIYPGDKKITIGKTAVTFAINDNNDDNADNATFTCIKMTADSYNLQYNYNSGAPRFAGYSSKQKPVRLYKEVVNTVSEAAEYAMAFHHTGYTGPVAEKNSVVRRVATVENPVEMTCTTASDGSLVYTCQPTKLCGNFGLTIEGQMLGGHKDHVVTLSCPESCTETHEEYVCVPDGGSPIRLVREESENHRVLSTNPNDYHNSLLLYHQPTVTVTAKPFERISLALDSRTGGTTGIEDIATDGAATAPVRLYNLNGVEIPAGVTPAPGLYMRRQGNTTAKVVIR